MSATTASVRSRTARDRSTMYRPGLLTLTRLEMRKMVDTRSGFWLLLVIALITVGGVALAVILGPDANFAYEGIFQFTVIPASVFLPLLGILMVTTEWSQRTVMSTFTLVPQRGRVAAAKVLAGVGYTILSVLLGLALAAVGYGVAVLLDRAHPVDWSLSPEVLLASAAYELIFILVGIAFGMLFQNSPLAIVAYLVLYFVLPIIFGVLKQNFDTVGSALAWIDLNGNASQLLNSDQSAPYGHVVASVAFWVVLPGVLGLVRTLKREVK
ncbi:ABC transporter permease [Spongisporangium articulatum]|uniref:ABC transporter permease n=1 Tax=Spongisporangium articulatum TaxID=3362603 RepID=A0ABW8AGV3_9ACTN